MKSIWRNFCAYLDLTEKPQTSSQRSAQCGKMKKLSPKKTLCQIISISISLVKTLFLQNFCQKCVRVNFRNYHTVIEPQCGKIKNLLLSKKCFVKSSLVISFTKFLPKICESSKFPKLPHSAYNTNWFREKEITGI